MRRRPLRLLASHVSISSNSWFEVGQDIGIRLLRGVDLGSRGASPTSHVSAKETSLLAGQSSGFQVRQ